MCNKDDENDDEHAIFSAEEYLQSVEAVPNYGLLLLQLLDSPDCEMFIRVAAAVNFKNFVKRNWRIVSTYSSFL